MRVSRNQFTVRCLMIVVAMVAIVLTIEIRLFSISKNIVSEHGDGMDYIPGEVFTAWAIFQIPVLLTLCLVYGVCRGIYRNW
jgi:hypothetical protein